MIAIQIGIIIFLILILLIIYQDEYRKRILARKSAKLKRFWNGDNDRRKSIRIDAEIDVLYEIVYGGKAIEQASFSRNISLGGINLALAEKLLPETIIKLQINLPQNPKPIFMQGKVVWVKEISKKFIRQQEQRFFATGIKFMRLAPDDENLLNAFINQRIKNASIQNKT